MARPYGLNGLKRRLKTMSGPAARKRIGAVLHAAGEMIAVEAQISISTGAVSGKHHLPSPPGRPPNYDTGNLADMIVVSQPKQRKGGVSVQVLSNAHYSSALEYGTSKMPARPFMRPAMDKMTPAARKLVSVAARSRKGR